MLRGPEPAPTDPASDEKPSLEQTSSAHPAQFGAVFWAQFPDSWLIGQFGALKPIQVLRAKSLST
jgi:hypothetical protein